MHGKCSPPPPMDVESSPSVRHWASGTAFTSPLGFSVFSFVLAAVASQLQWDVKRQEVAYLGLAWFRKGVRCVCFWSHRSSECLFRERLVRSCWGTGFRFRTVLRLWFERALELYTFGPSEHWKLFHFCFIMRKTTFRRWICWWLSVDDVDVCREFLMIIRIKRVLYSSAKIFWLINQFISGDSVNNGLLWATTR
jgi:hypothetical protein